MQENSLNLGTQKRSSMTELKLLKGTESDNNLCHSIQSVFFFFTTSHVH